MNIKDLIIAYLNGEVELESREHPGMRNCNLIYSKHYGWIIFRVRDGQISYVQAKLEGQFQTLEIE
jgi:hypothetical protein